MIATYTYSALFHLQNGKFLFTITNSVFPSNVNYTNYTNLSNLDEDGEREPDDFIKDKMSKNSCLLLKVYELVNGSFDLRNERKFESYY